MGLFFSQIGLGLVFGVWRCCICKAWFIVSIVAVVTVISFVVRNVGGAVIAVAIVGGGSSTCVDGNVIGNVGIIASIGGASCGVLLLGWGWSSWGSCDKAIGVGEAWKVSWGRAVDGATKVVGAGSYLRVVSQLKGNSLASSLSRSSVLVWCSGVLWVPLESGGSLVGATTAWRGSSAPSSSWDSIAIRSSSSIGIVVGDSVVTRHFQSFSVFAGVFFPKEVSSAVKGGGVGVAVAVAVVAVVSAAVAVVALTR